MLYKPGELVDTQSINQEGKLIFQNLESGKYYIKEKQAGEGYLIDETEYEVDLSYQNEEKHEIEAIRTLEEKVQKQAFQILKLNQKEETEYEELKNAGFSIYQISKLSIVQEGKIKRITKDRYELKDEQAKKNKVLTDKQQPDGLYKLMDLIDYYYKINYKEGEEQQLPGNGEVYNPYDLTVESTVTNYQNGMEGQSIPELTTNQEGDLVSPELAYGEYIIIETSVPIKYSPARPFIVSIETDSRQTQKLRYIVDPNFEAKIKINKIDANTKKNIIQKQARYVIKNLETGKLVINKTWEEQGRILRTRHL